MSASPVVSFLCLLFLAESDAVVEEDEDGYYGARMFWGCYQLMSHQRGSNQFLQRSESILNKIEDSAWNIVNTLVIVIVIVNTKCLFRHSKAKRCRAPVYSRSLRQVRRAVQRYEMGDPSPFAIETRDRLCLPNAVEKSWKAIDSAHGDLFCSGILLLSNDCGCENAERIPCNDQGQKKGKSNIKFCQISQHIKSH